MWISGLAGRAGFLAAAAVAVAAGFGEFPIRKLSLDTPGARISVGAAHVGGWWRLAFARAADTVTLENVTIEFEGSTIRIPRAEIAGTDLSRTDLLALLDSKSPEPWSLRLARLSASSIAIPEATERRAGPRPQTVTYRDLVIRDVAHGRAASATAASASLEMSGDPSGPQSASFGRITMEGLDLAEAARIATERAGADAAPMRAIYAGFSMEDLRVAAADGGGLRIARLSGRDVRARPTRKSWTEAAQALETGEWGSAGPAARSEALAAIADLLESAAIGSLELTGIAVVSAPASKNPGTFEIARMAYSGPAENRPADARIEGLTLVTPEARARLATISFTGFSFDSTIAALKALATKPAVDLDPSELRRLVPTIGTIRLSGLAFDGPNQKSEPAETKRIRFGLREAELTADRPVEGIPTNVRLVVDGLALALPADAPQEGLRDLAEMGYRDLDLSWTTATSWNEPGNELVIREISVRGRNMGSATVRGVLGSVTRDVFSPDTAVALVALVGATAKSLEVDIENGGLFERIIAQQAAKQSKSPDEFRRDLSVTTAVGLPIVLGNGPAAKAIGQAVARFLAKPGHLAISARTKDAAGLGVADFTALGDPTAVLDRLEVTATAD